MELRHQLVTVRVAGQGAVPDYSHTNPVWAHRGLILCLSFWELLCSEVPPSPAAHTCTTARCDHPTPIRTSSKPDAVSRTPCGIRFAQKRARSLLFIIASHLRYGLTFPKLWHCRSGCEQQNSMFPIKAVCEVGPKGKPCSGSAPPPGPGCYGTVTFEQVSADKCKISWEVTGAGPGKHGFHIHEKADFSNGCLSAGPLTTPMARRTAAQGTKSGTQGTLETSWAMPRDPARAR